MEKSSLKNLKEVDVIVERQLKNLEQLGRYGELR
jgi:hypothetical protein